MTRTPRASLGRWRWTAALVLAAAALAAILVAPQLASAPPRVGGVEAAATGAFGVSCSSASCTSNTLNTTLYPNNASVTMYLAVANAQAFPITVSADCTGCAPVSAAAQVSASGNATQKTCDVSGGPNSNITLTTWPTAQNPHDTLTVPAGGTIAGGATQLTTGLVGGHTYTSLPVAATTFAIASGESLALASGSSSQVVHASAAATAGVTSIPVQSFTAGAGYPAGAAVTVADDQGNPAPFLQVTMLDLSTPQDACTRAPLTFTYSAWAQANELGTTTALASSVNPSNAGQSVTFTATVVSSFSGPNGVAPTGTVSFYAGGSLSGCTVTGATAFGTSPVGAGGKAAVSTSTLPSGTDPITAVYSGDTYFSSSCGTLNQVVGPAGCITSVNATPMTGTIKGNLEVKPNTSAWLQSGTVTGNVTVDAGATFLATNGATIGGNLLSTNAVVDLGAGTSVGGNVQPTGGGPICIVGAQPNSPVRIKGNLQVQQLSASTTPDTICGADVGGNLQFQSNASPAYIGGGNGCTGYNVITGNLQVQNNSAAVTIGASTPPGLGNSAGKNIQVQGNSGGGTLTDNSAGGNCQLQGDKPGITGIGNTAHGNNTCNVPAPGA